MSARIAVVTDSTACLPSELASSGPVTVVPLRVVVRGESHAEGTRLAAEMLDTALRRRWQATTSRPGPSQLLTVYRELAASGASAVVSVHLSGQLSGTYDSAVLAAREAPLPVRAVDSGTLGMALGYAALSAATAAADGAGLDAVAAVAARRAARCSVLFYVDTLEHLRRGGRIGATQALVGSALAMKPLLHVVSGRIALLEKVRTATRALARLEEIAVQRAAGRSVDVAVQHLAALPRAHQLADRLRFRLADQLGELHVCEVGAVIGAHTGPGVLGVVIAPRD